MYIRDVANAVSVVNKTKTAAISVLDAYVPVTEIEDYCDILNHEEVPVFYIQVTGSMLCVGSTPITVCDGYEQEGPYGCDDFENGLITIPEVEMD